MSFRLGLKSAKYDSRDFMFELASSDLTDLSSASSKKIIQHDVPIINQGETVPCCVSIAVTTCLEILDRDRFTPLSFMFNYFYARSNPNVLSALEIRDGLKAAVLRGACVIDLFDPALSRAGATEKPTESAIQDARTRRIPFNETTKTWEYRRFSTSNPLINWKGAISNNNPVIVGIYVTKEYLGLTESNSIHTNPRSKSSSNNGHAVVVVGYDDSKDCMAEGVGAFLIRDSRGVEFGKDGYWWLPYSLAESRIIIDSWTVSKLTNL